jgi:hypothetical protein
MRLLCRTMALLALAIALPVPAFVTPGPVMTLSCSSSQACDIMIAPPQE